MTRLCSVLLFVLMGAAPPDTPDTREAREITVYAAASLRDAFLELGPLLERDAVRTRVRYNFAGSQQLAMQLEQGASADVFASADRRWMNHLEERNLTAGSPTIFAHNRLVVIVPRANPGRIRGLEDLGRPGVKLVLGAEAVPVGRYAREMLRRLEGRPGFPASYAVEVLANVVSQEENVKAVVAKVQLGEADAGFVYRSDVGPRLERELTVLEVPDAANVTASYAVVVLAGARDPAAARAFVDLLLGPEAGRVLSRHGLEPAGAP